MLTTKILLNVIFIEIKDSSDCVILSFYGEWHMKYLPMYAIHYFKKRCRVLNNKIQDRNECCFLLVMYIEILFSKEL